MKSYLFLLLSFFAIVMSARCQSDPSVWSTEMKVEDNKYILNLPNTWKKVTTADGAGIDYKYDFTGVGIPAMVGTAPLYAYFTISRLAGDQHQKAFEQVLNDFSVFYDRVTEPGYNYDTSTATIRTGQSGMVIHSRYYRRSKVSNYSKYYIIIYSAKTNETCILSLNFQYKDPTYDIERSAHFNDYAIKVFSRFELR